MNLLFKNRLSLSTQSIFHSCLHLLSSYECKTSERFASPGKIPKGTEEIITRLTADFGSAPYGFVNASDWFYEADGSSIGPISTQELIDLHKSGRIGRKTQVSSKSGTAGSWVSFESIAAKLGNSDVSRPEEKERKTEAFAHSQGSSGPADSDSKSKRELVIVGDPSPSQGSGIKKWVILVIIIAVIGWFAFSKIQDSREAAKKQEITELIKKFSEYVPLIERINRAQGLALAYKTWRTWWIKQRSLRTKRNYPNPCKRFRN